MRITSPFKYYSTSLLRLQSPGTSQHKVYTETTDVSVAATINVRTFSIFLFVCVLSFFNRKRCIYPFLRITFLWLQIFWFLFYIKP